MQSPFVLPPEDSRRLCCWGKVWTDMGSWALIQMLVSFFFLLVKRKQERVCQVWRSFDYSLWGLHVFFTWSRKWENWGEVGEDVWKQGLYLTLSCTFNNLVSEPCPSSQNFDGAGHALFIDNNCCRTSKGAHSQAREVEGTLRGKDGTQQLLGASSEPCQRCLIVPPRAVNGQSQLCQSQKCSFRPRQVIQVGFLCLSGKIWPTLTFIRLIHGL